jgi:hypothetical protein
MKTIMILNFLFLTLLSFSSCDQCGAKEDLIGKWKADKVSLLNSSGSIVDIDEAPIEIKQFNDYTFNIRYEFIDLKTIKVSMIGSDKVIETSYEYSEENSSWKIGVENTAAAELIFINCDRIRSTEKIEGTSFKLQVEMVKY